MDLAALERMLVERLPAFREAAERLQVPEADLPERLAMVGFALTADDERWSDVHAELVGRLRSEVVGPDGTAAGDGPPDRRTELACLGFGALLGLYQTGVLDDLGFRAAAVRLSAAVEQAASV